MAGKTQKEDEKKAPRDKIIPVSISSEMKESYLDYAMSVITSRALPDVRDGLKPVHRRILFAASKMGLTSSAKFRKSAAIVGDVLGKYHPHGDSSVYDAMVHMAQDFKLRYPLIKSQGNFGSIDGDSAAAMRYTEAKMSQIAGELLKDLEKDTVDFKPNYDETVQEPTVLPSALPNLLLNGTLGIAVGMATNIPPHNLREIVDACIHLIDDKKASTEDLLKYVKGPDFPTGGIIFNKEDIHQAYSSGRGGVVCRGEAEIVEKKTDQFQIIITSIPYRVNKSDLIIKIADHVRNKNIEGIKDLRDESTKDIRIAIDLKSGAYPQKILNYIYKHTELESTFHFNMLALVGGVPQTLSLKSFLSEFISHRQEVIKRRTAYELRKTEDREHILLGLKKALDNIDKIIKTIKASSNAASAHENLMKTFKFSDRQATAILEMRLQKLAALERKNIEAELKEKQDLIKKLKALLASPAKILKVIKEDLIKAKDKYGDDRRTKLNVSGIKSISEADLVPDKESVLVLTSGGYIKRTDPAEYRKQKRGGVGVIDLNTKDEDFVTTFITTSTHSDLLFFTDKGKVYQTKMYELPEGRKATRGKSIMNFLSLAGDEKVNSVLAVPKVEKKSDVKFSLLMVTKNGVVKKSSAESFKDVRRSGLIAIKLSPQDELLSAFLVEKGDNIILVTKGGQSVRFDEKDVREMGRTAAGVKALKLKGKDSLVGVDLIKKEDKDSYLLVVSENGFGKKTALKEYKIQKRGGSGIKTAQVTAKTGPLVSGKVIKGDESEVIIISKKGQVIRTNLKDISILGRQTQGVKIMRLRAGDKVASLTCI